MGRKPPKGKSLAEVNPELAKEWHPTKNGSQTAFDFSSGSNQKVWWQCKIKSKHSWEARIDSRNAGSECPMCGRERKPHKDKSLAINSPAIAKEWHPTKNGSLTPMDVSFGSTKKVWWKCPKGDDHEWEASPNNRSKAGCPICKNKKAVKSNSLGTINPELSSQWHPTKNGNKTPFTYTPISGVKVWWQCEKDNSHVWQASIAHRSNGRGCPYCVNKKINKTNSLAALYPEITMEWYQEKNGIVRPDHVAPVSGKSYWWKCNKGSDHIWKSSVANRTRGRTCPICSGHKVVSSTSLPVTHPKLIKEWHPTMNKGIDPNLVSKGSEVSVWWQCSKNILHEWKAMIYSRTLGVGCPYCVLTPQSRQELQISFELQLFFEIDPKGFKTRLDGKLWSIDIYIEEFNLGIEFDGSFWHKDKIDLDKMKTQKLKDDGFQVMRIREEPLKPITDIDVVSKRPFNAKQVANDILAHIIEAYDLNKERVQKISKYIKQKSLKNEKALDEYIEMILDEKSEKKQKRTTTAPKPH